MISPSSRPLVSSFPESTAAVMPSAISCAVRICHAGTVAITATVAIAAVIIPVMGMTPGLHTALYRAHRSAAPVIMAVMSVVPDLAAASHVADRIAAPIIVTVMAVISCQTAALHGTGIAGNRLGCAGRCNRCPSVMAMGQSRRCH